MKQLQVSEVKFPKLSPDVLPTYNSSPQKPPKSNTHSELLRIIISLLIAIFIYNSSQQTTINYNEIVKNQKMFLVKNIRGVLPTLSGNIRQIQRTWKVVHFQNYHQNDSQIFNNFTLTFNKETLFVNNQYCNFATQYNWKNYSYNIDLAPVQSKAVKHLQKNFQIKQATYPNAQQQSRQKPVIISQDPDKENISDRNSNTEQEKQGTNFNQTLATDDTQNKKNIKNSVLTPQQKQKKANCELSVENFEQVIKYTSVWTISDKNLYLLMQNANLQQDFYIILQPL